MEDDHRDNVVIIAGSKVRLRYNSENNSAAIDSMKDILVNQIGTLADCKEKRRAITRAEHEFNTTNIHTGGIVGNPNSK